jgi:uncharacterized membrane protein YhaH (DUF805 family)
MSQPPADQTPEEPQSSPAEATVPDNSQAQPGLQQPNYSSPPQYSAPPQYAPPPQFSAPTYAPPLLPSSQAPQPPQVSQQPQAPQAAQAAQAPHTPQHPQSPYQQQPNSPAAPQPPYQQQAYPPASQPPYAAAPPQYTTTPPSYAAAPPQYAAAPLPFAIAGAAGPGGYFDGALHANELNRPLYGANPAQAFIRFFKNYVNFKGRASRSEFWWMALITWGGFIVLALFASILENAGYSGSYTTRTAVEGIQAVFGLVLIVAFLGILLPWISLGWRRLQDANLHGALYLLNLVPYVGGLIVFVFTLLPPKVEGRRFDSPSR